MWQMMWLDPVPAVELDLAGWPIMLAFVGLSLVAFVALLVSRSPRRRARVATGWAAPVVRVAPHEITRSTARRCERSRRVTREAMPPKDRVGVFAG